MRCPMCPAHAEPLCVEHLSEADSVMIVNGAGCGFLGLEENQYLTELREEAERQAKLTSLPSLVRLGASQVRWMLREWLQISGGLDMHPTPVFFRFERCHFVPFG